MPDQIFVQSTDSGESTVDNIAELKTLLTKYLVNSDTGVGGWTIPYEDGSGLAFVLKAPGATGLYCKIVSLAANNNRVTLRFYETMTSLDVGLGPLNSSDLHMEFTTNSQHWFFRANSDAFIMYCYQPGFTTYDRLFGMGRLEDSDVNDDWPHFAQGNSASGGSYTYKGYPGHNTWYARNRDGDDSTPNTMGIAAESIFARYMLTSGFAYNTVDYNIKDVTETTAGQLQLLPFYLYKGYASPVDGEDVFFKTGRFPFLYTCNVVPNETNSAVANQYKGGEEVTIGTKTYLSFRVANGNIANKSLLWVEKA